jgi:hypothetical protein
MKCIHYEINQSREYGCTLMSINELHEKGYISSLEVPNPREFSCSEQKSGETKYEPP